MMVMRLRSHSKCRRMSGNVPRPIDPKPIITIEPSIFACMGHSFIGAPRPTGSRPRLLHGAAGIGRGEACQPAPDRSPERSRHELRLGDVELVADALGPETQLRLTADRR